MWNFSVGPSYTLLMKKKKKLASSFLIEVNKKLTSLLCCARQTRIQANKKTLRLLEAWNTLDSFYETTSVSATASLNQPSAVRNANGVWTAHALRAPATAVCRRISGAHLCVNNVKRLIFRVNHWPVQKRRTIHAIFIGKLFNSLISYFIRIIDHSQINAHHKVWRRIVRRNSRAKKVAFVRVLPLLTGHYSPPHEVHSETEWKKLNEIVSWMTTSHVCRIIYWRVRIVRFFCASAFIRPIELEILTLMRSRFVII